MTSITNVHSGLYSLADNSESSKTTSKPTTSATSRATDALTNIGSTSPTDMVSLSAAAQAYLQNLASSASTTSTNDKEATGFKLTDNQKAQINSILAKYKDAPFTQATYDAIQYDLQQAGLSPDQLQLQEKIKSFNSTQTLLDALSNVNGDQDTVNNLLAQPVDETKANDYMKSLVTQWQKLSTTYVPDEA